RKRATQRFFADARTPVADFLARRAFARGRAHANSGLALEFEARVPESVRCRLGDDAHAVDRIVGGERPAEWYAESCHQRRLKSKANTDSTGDRNLRHKQKRRAQRARLSRSIESTLVHSTHSTAHACSGVAAAALLVFLDTGNERL